jgi:GntR family transcriptional regulator / MocR family aminotransferase
MLNSERGLATAIDNICMVRGSQMGIYVAAQILVEPGDIVVTESLAYPPAWAAFRAAGAEVVAVDLDAHGMRMDQLEKLCRRRKVRAVYVTPHHQFPTTVLLRVDRRLRLLLLAEQFGFAIIEDDYDHEFHFTHRPMLPLASIDRYGKVIYIGSMSKLLSPSLRLGYVVAPARVIECASAQVTMIDRQGDPVTENAVAELMQAGDIRRHANKARRIYGQRRESLAAILNNNFSEDLDFILPEGGLAVWVRFRKHIDTTKLLAAAEAVHVSLLAGDTFSLSSAPVSAARLGFACFDEKEMQEASRRLRKALTMAMRR